VLSGQKSSNMKEKEEKSNKHTNKQIQTPTVQQQQQNTSSRHSLKLGNAKQFYRRGGSIFLF